MSWENKEHKYSFEDKPIQGLHLLDGDMLAKAINAPYVKGQKFPVVEFPSGTECEIWEGRRSPIIHIYGEMDLALHDTRDEAFEIANHAAEECGYFARKVGDSGIEVWGNDDDEHYLVTYDNDQKLMVDVAQNKAEKQENPPLPAYQYLTDKIRANLPPLYANEKKGAEAIAQVKYFDPSSNTTWYASEGSPVDEDGLYNTDKEKTDFVFFGLTSGVDVELGYFSLSELTRTNWRRMISSLPTKISFKFVCCSNALSAAGTMTLGPKSPPIASKAIVISTT